MKKTRQQQQQQLPGDNAPNYRQERARVLAKFKDTGVLDGGIFLYTEIVDGQTFIEVSSDDLERVTAQLTAADIKAAREKDLEKGGEGHSFPVWLSSATMTKAFGHDVVVDGVKIKIAEGKAVIYGVHIVPAPSSASPATSSALEIALD